jgi:hypothetical protein
VPCAFAQSSADLTICDAKLPTTVKSELANGVVNGLSDLGPIYQKRIAYDTWVTFLRLKPSALPAILLSVFRGLCHCHADNTLYPDWSELFLLQSTDILQHVFDLCVSELSVEGRHLVVLPVLHDGGHRCG